MTKQTQRIETLEELARHAVETPEEIEPFIQESVNQRIAHLKASGNEDVIEFDGEESFRQGCIKSNHRVYQGFKYLLEGLANPPNYSKILEQDRGNLLKLIRLRKGQDFLSRERFIMQKFQYYFDLRNKRSSRNPAQMSPNCFGNTGVEDGMYRCSPFGHASRILPNLGKRSYEKMVERIKTETPRIWDLKAGGRLVDKEENRFPQKVFFGLMATADSLVQERYMTKQEWDTLSSITEEAIKWNETYKKRHEKRYYGEHYNLMK